MRTARDHPGAGHAEASSRREEMLVDDLLDVYIAWRESARAVADAYARWSSAPTRARAARFAAYAATLDQEQKTAESYAEAVADLERWVQRSDAYNTRIDVPGTYR